MEKYSNQFLSSEASNIMWSNRYTCMCIHVNLGRAIYMCTFPVLEISQGLWGSGNNIRDLD